MYPLSCAKPTNGLTGVVFLLFHSSRPKRCDHIPPPPPCAPPRPRPCLFSLQSSTKPLHPLIMSTHVWLVLALPCKMAASQGQGQGQGQGTIRISIFRCILFYVLWHPKQGEPAMAPMNQTTIVSHGGTIVRGRGTIFWVGGATNFPME